MDQEQTTSRPTLVTIIGVLMIIGGIFTVLGVGAASILVSLSARSATGFDLMTVLLSYWIVISGIINIIIAIYLLKMKKWVIYLFAIIFLIEIIKLIFSLVTKINIGFGSYSYLIIEALIIAYLWSIRKKFN